MSEPLPEDFVRDFKALFEHPSVVKLKLSRYQAWCLMATIQLAFKHPTGGRSSPVQAAAQIARSLQEDIATTPALKMVAEQGWTE